MEIAVADLDLARVLGDPCGAAAFEEAELVEVAKLKSRAALLTYALDQATVKDGLYLEFGVYKGASINRAAGHKPGIKFHGFDSFVGLPERWTMGAGEGAFSVGGKLPPVRRNVELIVGFYDAALPQFVARNAGRSIAFMHIDCDLYSSTKTVLSLTGGMMTDGTVILFDEFFNHPGWQRHGEYRAFKEFIAESGLQFEFIGYIRHNEQMAVRIRKP